MIQDPLEALMIEAACRRLAARYCLLVDARDHPGLLDLWTPDAVWISVRQEMHGRDAIRAYLDAKPPGLSQHLCGNHIVDVATPTEASGSCDFLVSVVETDPDTGSSRIRGVPIVGRYHDRYRKVGDRWLFARRATTLLVG